MNLFEHQQRVLNQTKDKNRVAYYLDMGLGKTFVGSEKMMSLRNSINLVVCQKSKVADWVDHFKTVYGCSEVYDLTDKKDFSAFMRNIGTYNMIAVINYELAWRRKELLNLENFTLMLDESSLIQNTRAKQTKFILKLKPENIILLSGTPVGGKYENLWSQMHLLGWDISEKLYKSQYINWKQIDSGGFKHWIVDKENPYKNVDRLKHKLIEHGSVFLKTEECFDLPEQTYITVNVDVNDHYKPFMKNNYLMCDGRELIGDTALSKLLYARQLCGQYNLNKLEAFRDLLNSTDDRVIVFYNFIDELLKLKIVCSQCGKPTSEINGHTKDLTAYEEQDNSVTLVQYQAGSMGLNLQKANKAIYFTPPLSSEHFEQSKKRIHRIGQTNTCFYYLMTCKDSVEENILQTLENRKDYNDKLFESFDS